MGSICGKGSAKETAKEENKPAEEAPQEQAKESNQEANGTAAEVEQATEEQEPTGGDGSDNIDQQQQESANKMSSEIVNDAVAEASQQDQDG